MNPKRFIKLGRNEGLMLENRTGPSIWPRAMYEVGLKDKSVMCANEDRGLGRGRRLPAARF